MAIGIACKVAVDLHGIKKHAKKKKKAVKFLHTAKETVHQKSQAVCNDHFHKVAPQNIGKGSGKPSAVEKFYLRESGKLWQKIPCPLNGTAHKPRKKGKVTAKMNKIFLCGKLSFCYIHKIADHLKEIKGKTNGHEKIRQQGLGKGKPREKALENISGIFEHKEQKQTQGQKNRQYKMNFPGSE